MRSLMAVVAVGLVLAVAGTAQAVTYQFMDITFDNDVIGQSPSVASAPTPLAPGNPIQTLQAIGGYDVNDNYVSPPTSSCGTVLVGDVPGMSKAAVMTTNPNNNRLGALWLDTGFSMTSQVIALGFDINVLSAPTVATGQPKNLNGGTAGILLGMNAYCPTAGNWAFLFAVAPTSETGGVFALRSPDNQSLIPFGTYVEGQTYRIDLVADYSSGTVDAYLDGLLALQDQSLKTGSVLDATTSEFFFHLNGENYESQVALDNITASNGVVPEPITMAGLMMGVGGLVGYVRRRAKK
jgi:hypothetical protein